MLDKKYLSDNYFNYPAKHFAEKFDVTIDHIYRVACDLKLTSSNLWEKQKYDIIKDYNDNWHLNELQKKYGHFSSNILNKLREWKVRIKTPTESHMLYNFDTTFFKNIDTEEKAYWLGFIYADGNVYCNKKIYKNIFQINLAKIDIEHLKRLKNSLKSKHPLYKDRNNMKFMIANIDLCKDLINLGVFPRKSLTLKFPTPEQVPDSLIHHFIRGYFDGDGSIYYNNNRNNWHFELVGTWPFLSRIREIFSELNIARTKLTPEKRNKEGKIFYLTYGGSVKYKNTLAQKNNNLSLLYNYLYKDCIFFLDRKKIIFDNIIFERGCL